MLAQNVTLLQHFKERINAICRLGGNRSFEPRPDLEQSLTEMSKCYCIIATNQKLYEIAKAVNPRVYLIPNGIDLDQWQPVKRPARAAFTVGFCGNITTPYYRDYKGFDFVEAACTAAKVKLRQALYNDNQIPHEEMREKFYAQIDCIVHPTLGEGCSNTLMEACACGVPVITTRTAGFHGEMMTDGEDVLFCERSVESIKAAIERLRKDKALRLKLSAGARAFAEKHHDVKNIAVQYDKIFHECAESVATARPEVKFYSIISRPGGCTAVFNINGNQLQSRDFPAGWNKEQIEQAIISERIAI